MQLIIASAFCGLAAWGSYKLLDGLNISDKIITLIAIVIAVIVYAGVLLLIKGLSKEDVLMLPAGEKIAKVLEKLHVLG